MLLLLLGVVGGVRAAAIPSSPLLALTAGGLGSGSRLVALEPRTLEPRGSLPLPGWAFGLEWARSPDGAQLAVVPKPSETSERLFVIGVRGSLRVLARIPLPGEDVCRLAWPSARRILLVLTSGPACYNAIESARVLVIDPLRAQVVARHPLSGPTTVVATAPTREGLALLLAPSGRRSGARLVLLAANGARTIRLPRLHARPRPLDKSVLGSAIGLTVDAGNGRAYVVESAARVIEVNLSSSEVSVHSPSFHKPAAAEKGRPRTAVQALSLGNRLLAITGVRWASSRLEPLGLWLVDTRDWRTRLIEPDVTGVALTDTTLLAFQPSFDQLGGGIKPIGLRGYNLVGSIRFNALDGRPVFAVRAHDRYAYAAGPGRADISVIDLGDGRVEAPDPDAMSISLAELL
jgi:hypothetical protein